VSLIKPKLLTFMCAKCFNEKMDKLAWFVSKNSIWNESFLCRLCFHKAFKQLTNNEKGEWAFYDNRRISKPVRQ
jgi:hypothetical protein